MLIHPLFLVYVLRIKVLKDDVQIYANMQISYFQLTLRKETTTKLRHVTL